MNSQELEKQLKEVKKRELSEKWEKYLFNLHAEVDKLKNKTICAWIANGRFALYQIKDVKEQYYADREGFTGQFSPKRWLEITTHGYIICEVADNKGKWFNAKIQAFDNYKTFKFKTYSKKDGIIDMSKVTFQTDGYYSGELDKIKRIGFTEYNEYSEDPQYTRALEWLTLFTHIVPNEVWDAAYEIHKINVEQTHKFWEKFKTTIEKAPRVYETVKI